MRYLHLIFCCLFAASIWAQRPSKYDRAYFERYPAPDSVMIHYYLTHPNDLYIPYFSLEKRIDGWYLLKTNADQDEKRYTSVMIWDAKKGKFKTDLNKSTNPEKRRVAESMASRFRQWDFFIMPLYGYDEASDEIIELLQNFKTCNASELEALSRAYYTKAIKCLDNNYSSNSYKKSYSKYDSTFNINDISKEKINKAKEYALKTIETDKKLLKEFPNHQTMIGSFRQKAANNCVFYYHFFMVYQQPDIAKIFLEQADYAPAMIEWAKNYLKSCPPNAILLTFADNDTYPLEYVQAQLGFREDITIINQALMASGQEIYYVTKLLPKKQRIKTTLDIKCYQMAENNYIRLIRPNHEISLKTTPVELIDFLENYNVAFNDYKIDGIPNIKDYSFSVSLNGQDIELNLGNSYLFKHELFLLDILANNDRPICFSYNIRFTNGLNAALRPYLYQRGLVALLQENYSQSRDYILPTPDREACTRLLDKEYVYPTFFANNAHQEEYQTITQYILYLYIDLWNQLDTKEKENSEDFAAKKIKNLYQYFPLDKIPYHAAHLYAIIFLEKHQAPSTFIDKHIDAFIEEMKYLKQYDKSIEGTPLYRFYPPINSVESYKNQMIEYCISRKWNERAEKVRNGF